MSEHFTCPVCGFPGLDEPPKDEHGCSSFEICNCCGTEFGYEDTTTSYAELRRRWVAAGSKWWSSKQPTDWDPNQQLERAGLTLS